MSYIPVRNADHQETPSLFGVEVLHALHNDAKLFLLAKIIRMFSFGFLSVMLVLYLSALDYSDPNIGLMFTLTLLGDAVISLFLTSHADKFGRKKTLIIGSGLSIMTGLLFATQKQFWIMLFAGVVGVISPSGSEIGPFMAVELAGLSQVTKHEDRTRLMAWYNLGGSFASAMGALVCGYIISTMSGSYGYTMLESYRIVMFLYSAIQICLFFIFSFLSPDCEVPLDAGKVKNANPVTLFLGLHKSKGIVLKLCCLFIIDSFAGSFVLQSLTSNWFFVRYQTSAHTLGSIIFFCNIVAGVSALFAARLADIIGLVMTMVVTHLPSNILLILTPLMPSEKLAILMLCTRYSISQMDVPIRNAYVQGVVDVDERSAATGVTNVVRSVGAAFGPYIAGLLYANSACMDYPWYIAGGLKIVYDLLLCYSFLSVTLPEEDAKAEQKRIQLVNKA